MASERTITIPTELIVAALRQLFPAERMVILGGRQTHKGVRVTTVTDITEAQPTTVHVRACPRRLTQTLVDYERTGAHFAVWMHSHPGKGPCATYPSSTDLNQEADLRQHYSKKLLCVIAVADGWFRVWGEAISRDLIAVRWLGDGIEFHPKDPHVFRIAL